LKRLLTLMVISNACGCLAAVSALAFRPSDNVGVTVFRVLWAVGHFALLVGVLIQARRSGRSGGDRTVE